mmetsp:Transcript_5407/g.20360  ORF Transcript_5407/g.20360 Transcript_5407/m.20360 type:complete len:361 (+) Transcript_5407:656-1738(+)
MLSNRAASNERVALSESVVLEKCASNNRKHRSSSAWVSYRTVVDAQKQFWFRCGWFMGNGAGSTEQNRCTNNDARNANVFGNTSDWFANNKHTCVAARIAPDASSTVATESGTLVISTGRIIGGGCDAPASVSTCASPPSAPIASLPNKGDAHAIRGVLVSGTGLVTASRSDFLKSLTPADASSSSTGAGSNGGGNSAGFRKTLTRVNTPSTHRITRARVSGSTAGSGECAALTPPDCSPITPDCLPIAPAIASVTSGDASAIASACFPAADESDRHAHSSAAAGAAARRSPGTDDKSCKADSSKTCLTPISTSASARRGDTPGDVATNARAASSASLAHEASPPLAFAVKGVARSLFAA